MSGFFAPTLSSYFASHVNTVTCEKDFHQQAVKLNYYQVVVARQHLLFKGKCIRHNFGDVETWNVYSFHSQRGMRAH